MRTCYDCQREVEELSSNGRCVRCLEVILNNRINKCDEKQRRVKKFRDKLITVRSTNEKKRLLIIDLKRELKRARKETESIRLKLFNEIIRGECK